MHKCDETMIYVYYIYIYLGARVASKFWCSSSETVFYWIAAEIFGMRRFWHKWHRFVFSHVLLARDFPISGKVWLSGQRNWIATGGLRCEGATPLVHYDAHYGWASQTLNSKTSCLSATSSTKSSQDILAQEKIDGCNPWSLLRGSKRFWKLEAGVGSSWLMLLNPDFFPM